MNIEEAAYEWFQDHRNFVKTTTMSAYFMHIRRYVVPEFGPRERITGDDVQDFVLRTIHSGLSQKTTKDIYRVLKMIYRYGVKKKWFPAEEWDIRWPEKEKKTKLKTLTAADQKKLMQYIETHFSFTYLGIYISLSTGVRVGEVCGLKWSDIDLDRGVLSVNRTVERIMNIGRGEGAPSTVIYISTPKTVNSAREIPISSGLKKMLKPLSKICNNAYFVVSNKETPAEPRFLRSCLSRLLAELHIPRISFHGLRHTFATRCIERGCDVKTVSLLLGHADVETTLNLYVHPSDEQKRRAVEKALRW